MSTNHLEITAEIGIFVFQRVKAMRAVGENLFHFKLVKHLHVGHRHHLENILAAQASGRIAGAGLIGAKYSVINPGGIHKLYGRLADFDIALVQRPGTANPEQPVGIGVIGNMFDFEVLIPIRAGRLPQAPGITGFLQIFQTQRALRGYLAVV